MIDLEKEREAFSNWFESNFSIGEVIFGSDGIPLGYEKALSWKAWQAAKSQVPEDFVLVPKDVINVLKELTQFSSYAEIVGGISVNRSVIREQCDIAFNLIRELEDAEFAESIEAAQGEGR